MSPYTPCLGSAQYMTFTAKSRAECAPRKWLRIVASAAPHILAETGAGERIGASAVLVLRKVQSRLHANGRIQRRFHR